MIDPRAVVDPGAKIGKNVSIGPFSVIGPDVVLGDDTWVGPHVVINGHTVIGKRNKIYQFASVGEANQDKKYRGEPTRVVIGDDNVIREGVTLHRGTTQGTGVTVVGNDNLFMNYVHLAHDCVVGDHCILVNGAQIAGHVTIDDHVIISGLCAVHQFVQIGAHAFISHASMVSKDVPPYVMLTGGADVSVCGLNVEGLKRRGFSHEAINHLRQAYKIIYRQGLLVADAIVQLEEMVAEAPEVKLLSDFLRRATRGIVR